MVYRQSPNVVTREIAGEMLLVPIRGELADVQHIFTLNAVGAYVWERLDGLRDLAALAGDVAAAFEIDAGSAADDVRAFVDHLAKVQLVVPA